MRLPPIRITTRLESPALRRLYGSREPFLYAGFGGEPLSGVGIYANPRGPHWHYVGFGLRERFGHELSFRLAADDVSDASTAPTWPVRLLQGFARHSIGSQVALTEGQYLHLPDALDPSQPMRSGALVPDPELDGDFLQVVGLHDSELELMSEDGYESFLRELRERDALLITDPDRPRVG